jgi:ATP-dependent Clp protease ATP-binding subunit ClpA
MFERFTDKARALVTRAQFEARSRNHAHIGTEHLLLAMLNSHDNNMGARVLGALGVQPELVLARVDELVEIGPERTIKRVPFTPRAKKALDLALREAMKLGHNYIGTEHVLLGLLCETEGMAARVLAEASVPYATAHAAVVEMLQLPAAAGAEEFRDRARDAAASRFERVTAADVLPPVCPGCNASLLDAIAYKVLDVPEDGGPGRRRMCFVYCEACGHVLNSRFEPEAE